MKKISLIVCLMLVASVVFAQEANYDESKVGSYILPDALTTLDGKQVTKKKQWERKRRDEVLKLFEDNEYGIIPSTTKNGLLHT